MLPNGWKKSKIGETCSLLSGQDFPPNLYGNEEKGLPYITGASNFAGNHIILNRWTEHPKNIAKKGDILLVCKGSGFGITAIADFEKAHIARQVMALQKLNGVDKDFLYQVISMNVRNIKQKGCGLIPGIDRKTVLNIEYLLPPIEEQKKIAATLSVWDTAIEKMEKLLEAKIVQKNSLTYKLIENQNDVKFKLGNVTIDKSKWEKKSLKEFGLFSKGQGIKRDEAHSGSIAAVRYGEIYTTHNDYIKEFHSFISEDVAKKSKLLKKGDLLFSCSGETKEDIGKCVAFVSNVVAYAGGDIIIFSPQIECDSKYLGFLLNARSINKQKYGLGQGDSIVHISAESIGRLTVFLPSYSEQKAIADVLSAIDDELFLLKQQLENYKRQKQGLMQKLLTGQWRVK